MNSSRYFVFLSQIDQNEKVMTKYVALPQHNGFINGFIIQQYDFLVSSNLLSQVSLEDDLLNNLRQSHL